MILLVVLYTTVAVGALGWIVREHRWRRRHAAATSIVTTVDVAGERLRIVEHPVHPLGCSCRATGRTADGRACPRMWVHTEPAGAA